VLGSCPHCILNSTLSAQICFERFGCEGGARSPHVLPCGHSYCLSCVGRLREPGHHGVYKCPQARALHLPGFTTEQDRQRFCHDPQPNYQLIEMLISLYRCPVLADWQRPQFALSPSMHIGRLPKDMLRCVFLFLDPVSTTVCPVVSAHWLSATGKLLPSADLAAAKQSKLQEEEEGMMQGSELVDQGDRERQLVELRRPVAATLEWLRSLPRFYYGRMQRYSDIEEERYV